MTNNGGAIDLMYAATVPHNNKRFMADVKLYMYVSLMFYRSPSWYLMYLIVNCS